VLIRPAEPADYARVIPVVDEWWGGRPMAAMLPKLFYERFFAAVAPRSVVRAVTSPANERSLAFHRALGFEVERIDEDYDGQGRARALLVYKQ